MDLATVTGIILGTISALMLGMAALIKTMVVGKLNTLQDAVSALSSDIHHLDLRITKLEVEHALRTCAFRGDE